MPESYYGSAEIDMMMAEFGVDVTIAGVTVKCVVDRVDEAMLVALGKTYGRAIMVQSKTGIFPGLVIGVTAIVDGASLKVREILKIDDGALTKFLCAVE